MPTFSVILPVRNGGQYVKECVNSILGQTHPHFNLLVLDNDSTDGTLEWIRSIQDDRIVIYPSNETLSIEKNWARIANVPKNEFMTCIGHDDVLMPGYLEEMIRLIGQYPDASLYQTHFNFIDARGERIRPCYPVEEVQQPAEFLSSLLKMKIDVNGTGFMVRSADYDRMGGIPPYPNLLFADFHLWLEMARISYKVTSPFNGFSYRLHQSMTTSSTDERYRLAFDSLMDYLDTLKKDPACCKVINEDLGLFLRFYCRSFSHRLLRTPLAVRQKQTVKEWVAHCDELAARLIDDNALMPSKQGSVTLAGLIDSNAFTRRLFLLFKKLYPKPVF